MVKPNYECKFFGKGIGVGDQQILVIEYEVHKIIEKCNDYFIHAPIVPSL